ncbi:MAG: hypothetical protein OQK75_04465 [Gammaproteobacteria bacterium]|nr:hypothetical protein [Gammaproteobacteria bacterium]MCW8986905.1 hypothetical protein [Gammaproteobacteria bacterium]MCW9030769.1 hypothetical protein [Gammaproteobacteria bacterium]
MEMIYYTIAAVVLYLVSDYILNAIEVKVGKRLPSRSLVFFIIISILAFVSFSFIRAIFGPLPTAQQPATSQVIQTDKKPAVTKVLPVEKETKK